MKQEINNLEDIFTILNNKGEITHTIYDIKFIEYGNLKMSLDTLLKRLNKYYETTNNKRAMGAT